MALTRGGVPGTPSDTQVPYLETVFRFLGKTDVHYVYAEGLAWDRTPEQAALASAYEQIEEAVASPPRTAGRGSGGG
jgi:FMN-dependent NADH-azoreductase